MVLGAYLMDLQEQYDLLGMRGAGGVAPIPRTFAMAEDLISDEVRKHRPRTEAEVSRVSVSNAVAEPI